MWADWKAKTKKKASEICEETSGANGGQSSRLLTGLEERLLGIMGLITAIDQTAVSLLFTCFSLFLYIL